MQSQSHEARKPEYTVPEVRSIPESELLDQIGPAQAYTGNFPFGF